MSTHRASLCSGCWFTLTFGNASFQGTQVQDLVAHNLCGHAKVTQRLNVIKWLNWLRLRFDLGASTVDHMGKVENPNIDLDGIIHMGVDFLNP